jgi:hypothetical protein
VAFTSVWDVKQWSDIILFIWDHTVPRDNRSGSVRARLFWHFCTHSANCACFESSPADADGHRRPGTQERHPVWLRLQKSSCEPQIILSLILRLEASSGCCVWWSRKCRDCMLVHGRKGTLQCWRWNSETQSVEKQDMLKCISLFCKRSCYK